MSDKGIAPRLHVCLPAYDDIDPMTVHSLFELRQHVPFTLDMIGVAEVAVSRTMLMDRIDPDQIDYVLWIDADMVFAPQHFMMLFEALQKSPQIGLISGLAVRRDGSNLPCVSWREGKSGWLSQDKMIERVKKYIELEDVKSVDVTGLAFTLMDTAVMKKIKKPYFHPKWIENPDKEGDYMFFGEDSDFVKQLQAKGFDPSVHFGVHVGHVGKKVYIPRPPERIIKEQMNGEDQPDASDPDPEQVRDGSEVSSG